MPVQIGNCGQFITLGKLVEKDQEQFVRKLTRLHKRFSDSAPEKGQIEAWRDCFDALRAAFAELPEEFRDIWAVFEYVLPRHAPWTERFRRENHIRADVILVSADCALVLEFKRKDKGSKCDYGQALMYKRRLKKYHVESLDLKKEALLVLTRMQDYCGEYRDERDGEEAKGCSADRLAGMLQTIMGEHPRRHEDIRKWLGSEFQDLKGIRRA